MNDLEVSELVSKSLSGVLTSDEQDGLEQHLKNTPEASSFATLSNLIQKSVSDMKGELSDSQAAERLSGLARERIRQSLRNAQAADSRPWLTSSERSQILKVAEAETAYYSLPQSSAAQSNSALPGEDETRQAVSRFTLLRKIGQGGLGTVWLARDEKLKRNVALKELNPSSSDSRKLWLRFAREAEITGHLEHPNVVPLYMSGVNPETGMPFYAMRFLGKQTLADAIAEYHARRTTNADDPIHLHRLLNAFLDVCQAIAFAHSRGVIHRDLKPENIALDNFGQVVVLDWGLAKLESDGELATRLALSGNVEHSAASQTLDGDVVGTPLYMAPEQAMGEMSQLDERTDVYGLGAILFAILTGSAPHENSNRSESGSLKLKDMLDSIASSDTPRPRDFNPSVPRDLEAICLRAMSKQRFARHASAEELAREVENWIAGRHRLQARYDTLRLTGRDLKSRLCVQIRQLIVTAQFMVELPPIQGLLANIDADPAEFSNWRERLSTILLALAKTKSNISGLSFSQIKDGKICELVRVERSLHDIANIRTLPQSRLRRGIASTFHKTILEQFPGECCLDFDFTTSGVIRLVAGVPVFDASTEEPFGLVLVEAEIGTLVRPEIDATETTEAINLIDDKSQIVFSTKASSPGRMASEEMSRWSEISHALTESQEFIDADREYYATRLSFPQRNNSLRIVLQVAQ